MPRYVIHLTLDNSSLLSRVVSPIFVNNPFIMSISVIARSVLGPVTIHICVFIRLLFLTKPDQVSKHKFCDTKTSSFLYPDMLILLEVIKMPTFHSKRMACLMHFSLEANDMIILKHSTVLLIVLVPSAGYMAERSSYYLLKFSYSFI